MTQKHIAMTMAALNYAATPPHLRPAPGTSVSASSAPTPIAGAAPRVAAQETIDWGAIVSDLNASLALQPNTQTKEGAR